MDCSALMGCGAGAPGSGGAPAATPPPPRETVLGRLLLCLLLLLQLLLDLLDRLVDAGEQRGLGVYHRHAFILHSAARSRLSFTWRQGQSIPCRFQSITNR